MHKMALKMGKLEKNVIKRLKTSYNHLSLFNDQVFCIKKTKQNIKRIELIFFNMIFLPCNSKSKLLVHKIVLMWQNMTNK